MIKITLDTPVLEAALRHHTANSDDAAESAAYHLLTLADGEQVKMQAIAFDTLEGGYGTGVSTIREQLKTLGLEAIGILNPALVVGYGRIVYTHISSPELAQRLSAFWEILYPDKLLQEPADPHHLPGTTVKADITSERYHDINRALALHVYAERSKQDAGSTHLFVTTEPAILDDANRAKLAAVGAANIFSPTEATAEVERRLSL